MSISAIKRLALRRRFYSFAQKAFASDTPDAFISGDYVKRLCEIIQQHQDGAPQKLIVNLPPRHLKTFIFAVCLVAWELGRKPKAQVLIVAGSEELAKNILKQIQGIMTERWYKECFPTVRFKQRNETNIWTTAGGLVHVAPIFGKFTGFGGGIIIVDDAADIADADNLLKLDSINKIFDEKVLSRRNNPGTARILVIAHRLSDKDLSAHLSAKGGWERISLSLKAEKDETFTVGNFRWSRAAGEFLRPEFESEFESLRQSPNFSALYQQNPGGRAYPKLDKSCIKVVDYSLSRYDPACISVDPARAIGPGRSYSTIQVWQQRGSQHVLFDQVRGQFSYGALKEQLWRLCKHYRPSVILIEDNSDARGLTDIPSRNHYNVQLINVGNRSKLQRLARHASLIQNGFIAISAALEGGDIFIEELTEFPNYSTDDQVDTLTQYLDHVTDAGYRPSRPPEPGLLCYGTQAIRPFHVPGTPYIFSRK